MKIKANEAPESSLTSACLCPPSSLLGQAPCCQELRHLLRIALCLLWPLPCPDAAAHPASLPIQLCAGCVGSTFFGGMVWGSLGDSLFHVRTPWWQEVCFRLLLFHSARVLFSQSLSVAPARAMAGWCQDVEGFLAAFYLTLNSSILSHTVDWGLS